MRFADGSISPAGAGLSITVRRSTPPSRALTLPLNDAKPAGNECRLPSARDKHARKRDGRVLIEVTNPSQDPRSVTLIPLAKDFASSTLSPHLLTNRGQTGL
jgi:hypothetical protein